MARPTVTPRDQERPFGHDELFFSATDRRGVILACNEVFVRVSGHPREVLMGTAHNVIRHPDMPRAVFKLLWDHLAADKPFAGYVKNLAADGSYYWVVALVVPTHRGYLSIRFKPSAAFFPIVKDLYKELVAIERRAGDADGAWRDGMEQAGVALGAALQAHGFGDYDHFMHTLLAVEFGSHQTKGGARRLAAGDVPTGGDAHLGAALDECLSADRHLATLFSAVDGFLEGVKDIDSKAAFLLDLSANVHLVSVNALIASCRIAGGGDGFSVVTQSLAALSQASHGTIDTMARQLTTLATSLRQMAFAITAAKLQNEMTMFFLGELLSPTGREGVDARAVEHVREDVAMLKDSLAESMRRIAASVPEARQSIPGLMRLQDELGSDLRQLATVRLLGKIHAVGLDGEEHLRELLDGILEELQRAGTELDALCTGVVSLRKQLRALERSIKDSSDTVATLGAGTPVAA